MNNKNNVKIAFLGLNGLPPRYGGLQFDADCIGEYLVLQGFEIIVFCNKWYQLDPNQTSYKSMTLKVINTSNPKSFFGILYFNLSCGLYLIKNRIKIAYLFSEFSYAIIPLLRLFNIKTIIRRAGEANTSGVFTNFIILICELIGYYFSNYITTETIIEKNHALKYTKKEIIITPVVISPKIKLEPKLIIDNLNLQKNGYILYIGRFTEGKRIDWLINSFINISIKHNLKLVIAGDSSDKNYVNYLKSLSDDSRIIFTGYVNGDLKEELISNCFCMVLPSRSEGMSTAVAEALSFGKLCVLSDIPVHKWIIDDPEMGLLFNHNNQKDLTLKLSNLINGQYSYNEDSIMKNCAKRFNVDIIMQNILHIINKML